MLMEKATYAKQHAEQTDFPPEDNVIPPVLFERQLTELVTGSGW